MKERVKSIDSLRGLAILAVILIHTTTRTLEASDFNLVGFPQTLFLNQIARFAVPLFFIISGFVLEISFKNESYWSFIKRRLSKIFIPYALWSLIYYFFVYTNNNDNLFKVFFWGNASYQLYFIPALLVFYLLFPVIHKVLQKIPGGIVFAVFMVLGIFLLYKNYHIKAFDFGDHINAMILAFSYFVIGALSGKNKILIDSMVKKWKILSLFLSAILGAYIFLEGRSGYLSTGNYLSFYSQWRPSVFFYSILIALSFYYAFEFTKLGRSFISRFAKHSFFVFFIHVAVLEIFWRYFGQYAFSITGTLFGKIIFDLVFFTALAVVSFIIAKIIHRFPKSSLIFG